MASIDFDPEDYIDEISTSDLVRELKSRKDEAAKKFANEPTFRSVLKDIEECIHRRDFAGALLEIEKARNSPAKIEAAYQEAMTRRDPQTGRPVIQ